MADGNDATSGTQNDVPFSRFKEVNEEKKAAIASVAKKDTTIDALKAEIVKLQQGKGSVGLVAKETPPQGEPQNQPKIYTRNELTAAVKAGTISENDANVLYDQQQADLMKSTIDASVEKKVSDLTQGDATKTSIDRYTAVRPDTLVDGSADKTAVKVKFDDLVKRGHSKTRGQGGEETELLALELVFGSIDTLEAASKGKPKRHSHQETGGSDDGDPPGDTGGKPKGMTSRQDVFYTKQLEKGIYKDWSEVSAELEHQTPGLAEKHANS